MNLKRRGGEMIRMHNIYPCGCKELDAFDRLLAALSLVLLLIQLWTWVMAAPANSVVYCTFPGVRNWTLFWMDLEKRAGARYIFAFPRARELYIVRGRKCWCIRGEFIFALSSSIRLGSRLEPERFAAVKRVTKGEMWWKIIPTGATSFHQGRVVSGS